MTPAQPLRSKKPLSRVPKNPSHPALSGPLVSCAAFGLGGRAWRLPRGQIVPARGRPGRSGGHRAGLGLRDMQLPGEQLPHRRPREGGGRMGFAPFGVGLSWDCPRPRPTPAARQATKTGAEHDANNRRQANTTPKPFTTRRHPCLFASMRRQHPLHGIRPSHAVGQFSNEADPTRKLHLL